MPSQRAAGKRAQRGSLNASVDESHIMDLFLLICYSYGISPCVVSVRLAARL